MGTENSNSKILSLGPYILYFFSGTDFKSLTERLQNRVIQYELCLDEVVNSTFTYLSVFDPKPNIHVTSYTTLVLTKSSD